MPPNFKISKEEYMQHLRALVVALVRRHGQLTVRTTHELVNSAIAQYGIRDAADCVRDAR